MESRFGERHKKRRQNRILNSLISIVLILILIVGVNLFRGTPAEEAHSDSSPLQEDASSKDQLNEATVEYNELGEGADQLGQAEEGLDAEEEEEDSDSTIVNGVYTFSGSGGTEGPWDPIGTEQTGEHVTTYKKDTLDWEEMTLAIKYGAGLLDEEIILWRIGNGGDPQRAIGQISSKAEPDKRYKVTIEWVDGEGWQPIDVAREN